MIHAPTPLRGACPFVMAAAIHAVLALAGAPLPAAAQGTGTVLGRVVDAESGAPLAGAEIRVAPHQIRTLSAEDGRFVLAGVPIGERTLRVELLGYRAATLERVDVRSGRATEVRIELAPAAVALEAVRVQSDRVRLIEPDVALTHEVVIGRELRELPIDRVADAIELVPGVSDGHFRGGRVGQVTYVVDGFALKNQLEGSGYGLGLEFSPTSLEEVDVVTGGFGAEHGSALSGVVGLATRRGGPERWHGRVALFTDHMVPGRLARGFSGVSASAGGPLPGLGAGTTLFADLLAQGMLDAEPRARGLTCLRPADAGPELAQVIREIAENPLTAHLHCPFTSAMLPHQSGDKVIGFLRLDRPLPGGAALTASVLRNRLQRQLYTPEFKYNPSAQLGQRTDGALATVALDWTRHREGRAYHLTARAAASRLDRFLGVVDPGTFDRSEIGGLGFGAFRFLGESFVREPVQDQIARAAAVPGYAPPGGFIGSPFGPAAEGIFVTEGTPHIASWSRSEFVGGDVVAELLTAQGSALRTGGSARVFRVESYERVLGHLPGSAPNYARFFPATVGAFAEARVAAADEVTIQLGVRAEAFRPGLRYRADRADFLGPEIDTDWELSFMPRLGIAAPVPGSAGRAAVRASYGMVSQAPDFRFFLDTSIDDSLRTDLRRQGNPDLAFERGTSLEFGISRLVGEHLGLDLTAFRKELNNLVTSSIIFSGFAAGQFTTGDFGTVRGIEFSVRGRWPAVALRAGYALQKATGVASAALSDEPGVPADRRVEFPLAFDRRHALDLAAFAGHAAGAANRWGIAASASMRSGYPVERRTSVEPVIGGTHSPARLPWTIDTSLRVSYRIGPLPACRGCTWRLAADARNLLGRENVIGVRRETGTIVPSLDQVRALADVPEAALRFIPAESPHYYRRIDFDGDGTITPLEFRAARLAAAIDRFDPTLFYGEPRQLRIGIEVVR